MDWSYNNLGGTIKVPSNRNDYACSNRLFGIVGFWGRFAFALLFILISFLGVSFNAYADNDDDTKCTSGDLVTVSYGMSGSEDVDTLELEANGPALGGSNFLISVKCDDSGRYYFAQISAANDGKTFTANYYPSVFLSDIDGTPGEANENAARGDYDGAEYWFWFSSVKQKPNTANPETGVPDNEYNPTISYEENYDAGNIQTVDAALDLPKKECEEAEGAEALGWLVCPVLKWMGKAAEKVYDQYIEPSLKVGPELLVGEGGNVEKAWGMFRDAANIAFIILLIVVVVSQITGVGINNYGIKKILPKMILVIVLINLSYIICVLLVDFSNLLGNGFQAMFERLSGEGTVTIGSLEESAFMEKGEETESWSITSILAGVGVFAGIVAMVGAIWKNPSILISLLVAGLGIVVAVFFLFMLLAARKASIIVLTVVSPLAMACYMLPNTKKIFDRWVDFFKGLLLVYPITGLLVGAGDFVSRMLLPGSTDFFTWITAMIISIVPIFFIPMVLKNAFTAMGKAGGMLTSLGSKARGKTTGAMRKTEGYQRLIKAGEARRDAINLKKKAGAYVGKDGLLHEKKGARTSFAKSKLGGYLGADLAMGKKRGELAEAQLAKMAAVENMDINQAKASMQDLKSELTTQSMKADIAVDIGPKPVINKDRMRVMMQNDINLLRADNDVKAVPINPEVLKEKMETQQSLQLRQMYADSYSRAENADLLKTFEGSLSGDSGESTVAAMKELLARGQTSQVFNALSKANWQNMNGNVKNQLAQAMGGSGVDALKSYSKYLSTGGSAGFQEWSTGNISEAIQRREAENGVKDVTYIKHLQDGKANAMVNYSDSEMQFVSERAGEMSKNGLKADELGTMIKNVAIYSNNTTAQAVADKTMAEQIENGNINITNLNLTGEDLGEMREGTAVAMRDGMANRFKNSNPKMSDEIAQSHGTNAVRLNLGSQIAIAKGNAATMTNMNSEVGKVIGVK